MRLARPAFLPDPSLDTSEMERLQHEIAEHAVYTDAFAFDLTGIGSLVGSESNKKAEGQSASSGQGTADREVSGQGTADRESSDRGWSEGSSADPPLVAGVDQAFVDDRAVSAIVVSRGGEIIERSHAVSEVGIPYVPGLLSFREGGPILDAVEALSLEPDLWLFDGSGRIHYRQAGLATHVGVMLDAPAVGVAKNLLCGHLDADPDGRSVGWRTPVRADREVDAPDGTVIGYAFQSRQYDSRPVINPLYVSPGHRVSAETAVEIVSRTCGGYKLPEPTRRADAYADEVKREYE